METFTWCPRINPTEDVSYNTRKVKFGDGYEQVSGNGLNSRSQKWAMEFVGDDNYISAIRHFIDKHAGIKSFFWKPPLEPLGLYRCDEHKLIPNGAGNYTLSLVFIQAFKS